MEDEKKKEGYDASDYLLAGAAPALLGILAGVPEAGFEEGAGALSAMETSRMKADELRAKRFQELMKTRAKDTGKLVKGVAVKYHGVPTTMDVMEKKGKIYHPNTGEELEVMPYDKQVVRTTESGVKVAESVKYADILPKRRLGTGEAPVERDIRLKLEKEGRAQQAKYRKEIETIAKPFQKDFSDLATVKSVLDKVDTNPVEGAVAVFKLARVAQGAGVLSESDIKPFGGSRAFFDTLNQVVETAKTGRLTEENKAFLAETYNTLLGAQSRRYENEVGDAVNRRLIDALYKDKKTLTPKVSIPKKMELGKINVKALSKEERQAYNWARTNKKDPRSKKILERLRGK